jgi:hypothetical protein
MIIPIDGKNDGMEKPIVYESSVKVTLKGNIKVILRQEMKNER